MCEMSNRHLPIDQRAPILTLPTENGQTFDDARESLARQVPLAFDARLYYNA